MVCSCCHQPGHNIRSCSQFHKEEIAKAYVAGQAREHLYRLVDSAVPGKGLILSAIDKLYCTADSIRVLATSNTKNEKERAIIDILGGFVSS